MKRVLHIFLLTAVASALLTAPAHGAAPASASLASASGESSLTTLGALSPQSVEGGFAGALQYAIDSPGDYLFGRPTSDDTIYEWEDRNVDRGKNAALIPPGFGTPTSYLPNSGEYLTPNLVPGALSGGLGNQVDSVGIRDDYRISSLNCGEEDFAIACMRSNLKYGKNQKREDVKSHHYIISFDPRDAPDNGLTVDRAQALGEEFCKTHFPGHQALVCTHPDGHNHSGNIHVHTVGKSAVRWNVFSSFRPGNPSWSGRCSNTPAWPTSWRQWTRIRPFPLCW